MSTRVHDVMTPVPWTVPGGCSLEEAARLMRAWDVREVFVVDDGSGALCGVLTDADIIVIAIASGKSPLVLTAAACATPSAPQLGDDIPIVEALVYMRLHEAQRVPVVDGGGRLVGAAWYDDVERAARPT